MISDTFLETNKRIYFIGICGTGMAALAAMLKSRGHEILGSDENVYPPMSTFLADKGIQVLQGFDAAQVSSYSPNFVIIGNALSRGNPEVEFVLNEKLAYGSMPAALGDFFIRGRYSCVVTGTHGKTTITSLLAWILEVAGAHPSFFVGGIPENFGQGFQLENGRHFVVEGDEYDSAFFDKGPKFLHYCPDLLIINNIEFDHADIYSNLDEIKRAFRRLINIVPGNGHIIANADDAAVREVVEHAHSPVLLFGQSEQAVWQARHIRTSEAETQFAVFRRGEKIAQISTPLAGVHNVMNTLAAFIAADLLGIPHGTAAEAIASFAGVRRRLTQLASADDVLIFSDFAHHATAVRKTIAALRMRHPDRRLWAIFEPRTASAKRKVFEEAYYEAFDGADQVVIAPMHRPDKVPAAERLSVERIVDALRARQIAARTVQRNEELLTVLPAEARAGDIFLFMSNGEFDRVPERFAKAILVKYEA